ncbi:SulP family inorganic anion transporter [Fluviicola sp.]|jgi:MFS superfamily sulfate permease-like transporter|uniref:SulP family inorganic anion transporter n=1 Tax=Fluviicola sp. TaxID=1917219 RepID=UPI00281CCF4C|nr:SulP family inorganic anion transporter [Fluviicola sp.]MDR0801906.1 SulP family inorganic anion transporter [Fluviicola sp.]
MFTSKEKKINTADIVAGLSIAGLVLPQAVAYAGIAGLPPQAGIIGLLVGMLCYGLLGSSPYAIVSPTSSAALVLSVAGISVANHGVSASIMVLAVVFMSGVLFLIAAAAKLGSITDFIAKPVLRGFTFGLSIIIVVKPLASMVDVPVSGQNIFYGLYVVFSYIKIWNWVGLGVGMAALFLLFVCSKIKYVPGGLLVIALGILFSHFIDLSQYHVAAIGAIPLHLTMPFMHQFIPDDWGYLFETSLAVVLVLYSESFGSIRSLALKHNDTTSPDWDLTALGISNILSGLFGGMPVGAGYSGSVANEASGAKTRMAGLFSVVVILIIVLVFLPLIAQTPEPVLLAIVIHSVSHVLTLKVFKPYFFWKKDRFLIVFSAGVVLLIGIADGLLVAVGISLIILLKRLSETNISILGRLGQSHNFVQLKSDSNVEQVENFMILRPEQALFFANCDKILTQVRKNMMDNKENVHHVVISLEESPDIDSSTMECFADFFQFIMQQKKQLTLARLKDTVYASLQLISPPEAEKYIHLSRLSVDDAVGTESLLHQNQSERNISDEK